MGGFQRWLAESECKVLTLAWCSLHDVPHLSLLSDTVGNHSVRNALSLLTACSGSPERQSGNGDYEKDYQPKEFVEEEEGLAALRWTVCFCSWHMSTKVTGSKTKHVESKESQKKKKKTKKISIDFLTFAKRFCCLHLTGCLWVSDYPLLYPRKTNIKLDYEIELISSSSLILYVNRYIFTHLY